MEKNSQNKPLSGIFIGSFDLLTGIRLCYQKKFNELTDLQIDDIIKISLSNVHRQEQRSFENFAISTIEIQCYQLLVVNAIFSIASSIKNKFNTYYSVSLIFDSNKIRKNEHLNEMLIFWTKILANNVKNLLTQNNAKQDASNANYSSLEGIIDRISDECSTLVQSQINNLPSIDFIKSFDSNFYAAALTSHLQTQMTTVIELPPQSTDSESSFPQQLKNSKFNDLSCFLAHFTLPSQLELSSLEVKNYPTPGLFLQIVCSQKVPLEEFLTISPRPTTWIRLQNMKIFRTNEKLFLDQYKNAVQSNLYNNENDSTNSTISPYLRPFWSISSKLKKEQINKLIVSSINNSNCSSWVLSTLSMIQESPKFVKKMTTEQSFGSLIKLIFAFIAIKNEKIGINNENQDFLSMDQIIDIQKNELDLENNDDLLIVISIAQIFDNNTYKQMQQFLANNIK